MTKMEIFNFSLIPYAPFYHWSLVLKLSFLVSIKRDTRPGTQIGIPGGSIVRLLFELIHISTKIPFWRTSMIYDKVKYSVNDTVSFNLNFIILKFSFSNNAINFTLERSIIYSKACSAECLAQLSKKKLLREYKYMFLAS